MMHFFTYSPGYSCNNNCIFCTRPDNPGIPNIWGFEHDRTSEEALKELEIIRKNFDKIILTGGEPAIRGDFFEILKKCSELDFKYVRIQTNGRMFSDRAFCKKTINALDMDHSFFFSFHSHNKKTFETLAGKKGVFNETLQGLKNLLAEGASLTTATAVMKLNYGKLKELLEFFHSLGVVNSELVFVHPNGRAWVNRLEIVPKIEETIPFVQEALDFGKEQGMKITLQKFPLCALGEHKKFAAEFSMSPEMVASSPRIQFKGKECGQCKYYNNCPGIWANYLKTFNFKFKPFPKTKD